MEPQYVYNATVLRWVDGDTVDLEVDMGFRIINRDRFRLYGIDTPERGQLGYHEAIDAVNKMAPVGTALVARTYKSPDKYGRWLADLFVGDLDINVRLLQLKLAVPYYGGTKGV